MLEGDTVDGLPVGVLVVGDNVGMEVGREVAASTGECVVGFAFGADQSNFAAHEGWRPSHRHLGAPVAIAVGWTLCNK